MASDDQHRDAAGNGHAVELKPEFRALAERAKELAKREERRKTEQMKADTQRKAESTKAEERRIAENRRQEEKKRAERRQEIPPKRSRAAHTEWEVRRRKGACATAIQPPGGRQERRPRLPPQSRTRDMRSPPISGGAQRQRSPNASSVRKRNSRRSIAGRRTTVRDLHRDEMHSFKENEDTAIAIHSRQIQSIDEREKEALEALGAHRESLIGRAVTFFKGEAHYAREAEAIVDRCEAAAHGRAP